MTTDNQKKYEEAAKAHAATFFQLSTGPGYQACVKDFLAGASFAEKEFERWRKDYDATMLNNLVAVKEEAHNSAIDKCINAFKTNKGVLSFEELEKLKI